MTPALCLSVGVGGWSLMRGRRRWLPAAPQRPRTIGAASWYSRCRNPATGQLEGGSWSEHWRGLPDPGCQGSVLAAPDGRWLLFSNPASRVKRERMTVYLSLDGGRTWPVSRLLATGGWCAYSCMTLLRDGSIGIFFEHSIPSVVRDTRYEEIRWPVSETTLVFGRFTLDWLTQGADRTIRAAAGLSA